MTVASTSTTELSINDLVLAACRAAGLLSAHQALSGAQGQALAAVALTELDMRLKWLETKGVRSRSFDFYDLALTIGEDRYSLPANALDVIGDAMYMPASQSDLEHAESESQVKQVSQQEWHENANKNSDATPTRFYAHRSLAQIGVRFLSKPTEAGHVRFRIQRLLADGNQGAATLDLERPWQLCIKYFLAHDLALSQSKAAGRVTYLMTLAMQTMETCLGFSSENNATQVYIDHDCGYYG